MVPMPFYRIIGSTISFSLFKSIGEYLYESITENKISDVFGCKLFYEVCASKGLVFDKSKSALGK